MIVLDSGVKLYSTQDVSLLLGVGVRALQKYAKETRVEGRIISRVKYYTEEEIKRLLLK